MVKQFGTVFLVVSVIKLPEPANYMSNPNITGLLGLLGDEQAECDVKASLQNKSTIS